MDADTQNTLLALVVVIAALLAIQTFALVGLALAMRQLSVRMASLIVTVEDTTRNAAPLLRAARELLTDSKEKLGLVSQNLVEISQLTREQVTRFDGVMADVSDRLRLQVIRLDQLLSNTVARVEETTELVQHNVLKPIRELSAILAGVRTGLDFLLRRSKSRADRPATQEEEMFI